jgi:hypothetical protein
MALIPVGVFSKVAEQAKNPAPPKKETFSPKYPERPAIKMSLGSNCMKCHDSKPSLSFRDDDFSDFAKLLKGASKESKAPAVPGSAPGSQGTKPEPNKVPAQGSDTTPKPNSTTPGSSSIFPGLETPPRRLMLDGYPFNTIRCHPSPNDNRDFRLPLLPSSGSPNN